MNLTRTYERAKRSYVCSDNKCKAGNRMIQRGERHSVVHQLFYDQHFHNSCADAVYPELDTLDPVPDSGACGWPELVDEHAFINGR
jgi:hypothetical protein